MKTPLRVRKKIIKLKKKKKDVEFHLRGIRLLNPRVTGTIVRLKREIEEIEVKIKALKWVLK